MSSSKSVLVVYNTCGINGVEPVDVYKQNIASILEQTHENKKIIWSSCYNSQETIQEVVNYFGDKISVNIINHHLAVNQTFNHSVMAGNKLFGDFDGYMYVAGDVKFNEDQDSLSRLASRLENEENGIISPEIDNDNGYYWWFNFEEGKRLFEVFDSNKDFVVPVGATSNLHAKIFSSKIYKEFGTILPDIFVSYCTETIFSFIAASIKQKFIITNDVIMNHRTGQISSPEGNCQAYGGNWDTLFPNVRRSIRQIVDDPMAKQVGLGYEEWVGTYKGKMNIPQDKPYLMHDSNKFDSNGFSLNDNLKIFIKDNFYLSKDVLDYNRIPSVFLRGR